MSDRKYRHRGYQDSGSKPSGDRDRGGPRPEPQRQRLEGSPRGRSAGDLGPEVFKCARCGEVQRAFDGVAYDAVCRCGTDLHSCSNCKNFDSSTRWECRVWEQLDGRIAPKDCRNVCAYFTPRIIRDLSADKGKVISSGASPDAARKAFDDLFKK